MPPKEKLFFYQLVAADFLAALAVVPPDKRGDWAFQLALDLVSVAPTIEFASKLISEASDYREKKAKAGRAGMMKRYASSLSEANTVTTEANTVTTLLTNDITNTETREDYQTPSRYKPQP